MPTTTPGFYVDWGIEFRQTFYWLSHLFSMKHLKKRFINFCFVGVCLHLISVHHVRAWRMQRSEEGLRSSGTGVVRCHVESRTVGAKSDVIAMINFELSLEVIMLNLTMNTMSTFRY